METTAKRQRKAPTRAERRARTREELIDAAAGLFKRDGFHATSLDAIADEAGYTKGAVYSNFDGKEDLFFAVYERQVDRRVAEIDGLVRAAPSATAAIAATAESMRERADDGWLAVFFEFWAHVLRHPEHRARFAALHRRALEPSIAAARGLQSGQAAALPFTPELLATAYHALGNGLQLERLTRPDEVDLDAVIGLLMTRITPLADAGRP
jgi:AcrR family transcriptional regulator